MIKVALLFFLFSAVCFSSPIKVLFLEYPPLSHDKNDPKGVLVELVKAAAKESKLEIDIVFYPPKRALALFKEKNSFIVSTFKAVDEKELVMLPFLKVFAGFFGVVDEKKVKRVAYISGFKPVRKLIMERGYRPFPVQNYEAGLKAVKTGRVERFLGVNSTMNYYINKMGLSNVEMKEGPMFIENVGIVGKKGDEKKIENLSKGLQKIKDNEVYLKLVRKFLSPSAGSIDVEDYLLGSFETIRKPQSKRPYIGLD